MADQGRSDLYVVFTMISSSTNFVKSEIIVTQNGQNRYNGTLSGPKSLRWTYCATVQRTVQVYYL